MKILFFSLLLAVPAIPLLQASVEVHLTGVPRWNSPIASVYIEGESDKQPFHERLIYTDEGKPVIDISAMLKKAHIDPKTVNSVLVQTTATSMRPSDEEGAGSILVINDFKRLPLDIDLKLELNVLEPVVAQLLNRETKKLGVAQRSTHSWHA